MSRLRNHINLTIKSFSIAYKDNFAVLNYQTKNVIKSKSSKGDIKLNIPVYFKIDKLNPCKFDNI